MKYTLIIALMFFFTNSIAGKIKIQKDLNYVAPTFKDFDLKKHKLDVYYPENSEKVRDVIVFIHGGGWEKGQKESYKWMGRKWAKKGKVAVIINYRLAPGIDYTGMMRDGARALNWIYENIGYYGGNRDRIFVSGHSAGGHLAALLAYDKQYFESLNSKNPVHGAVLIDAFGLNLFNYLKEIHKPEYAKKYDFYKTFTDNELEWQKATPANYIGRRDVPVFVAMGGKTYPGIKLGTARFMEGLKGPLNDSYYIYHEFPKKRHVPMVTQMLRSKNSMYSKIESFMLSN
ncbi:MAG: acetyl esterase/lipase [Sphingobacteriales bacterium]|jgi:acetyl esterase/lipase